MLNTVRLKLKNTITNQLAEIKFLLQNKTGIADWIDPRFQSGIRRYVYTLTLASLLNGASILISFYSKNRNENALIENLYAQKEIGSLLYFFSHFPQNIFGFIFLWGFLPILVASIWYLAFVILNGKEKEASKPTLTLLSLNSLFIPLTGIVVQEIFSFLKIPFGAAGLVPKLLTLFWALLTFLIYTGSFSYSILGFRKQFDQPIGRAVVLSLSPAIFVFLIYTFFY
ncbi:hypothetical protein [Leptospira fainei]|nr:hypothetical protein [Leptospira fainei]